VFQREKNAFRKTKNVYHATTITIEHDTTRGDRRGRDSRRGDDNFAVPFETRYLRTVLYRVTYVPRRANDGFVRRTEPRVDNIKIYIYIYGADDRRTVLPATHTYTHTHETRVARGGKKWKKWLNASIRKSRAHKSVGTRFGSPSGHCDDLKLYPRAFPVAFY